MPTKPSKLIKCEVYDSTLRYNRRRVLRRFSFVPEMVPMLNEHLEHAVTQSLLEASELSSMPITITAENGIVTLLGSVQSYRRKLAAHQIVESCEGVASVVNNLTVDTPNDVMDETIARDVNHHLASMSNLPNQSIRVDARDGTLTLTGYVRNDDERRQAEDVAAGTDGVRDVCNMLIENPDRSLANEELANSIRAKIGRTIGMRT
jgi:osmotically-inducible protein OsmY